MKKRLIRQILCISILSIAVACKKEKASPSYTNVKILSVKITEIPPTETNGSGWDNNSGADVYFTINDPNNNVVVNGKSSTFENLTMDKLPISWNLSQGFNITNLSTNFSIALFDNDTDDFPSNADDLMGGYYFNMEDKKSGYPTTIKVGNPDSQLKIEFTVQWY